LFSFYSKAMKMHRFCERCELDTYDGNLWCQDPECPAEGGYRLLGYGDFLSDMKVTKLVRVWRTAALYEAERGSGPVLVKVAHPNESSGERLKREAHALQALSPERPGATSLVRSFLPVSRPLYPVLIPPFPSRTKQPFGEITYRNEARVFSVFRHASGKILSDLLLESPQIWHTQAAWLISTIAQALRPLARSNKCHLNLSPDLILVDKDDEGNFRPMLLDLGFVLDVSESSSEYDLSKMCEPAYTAPEVLGSTQDGAHTPAADVYSLGMIYYEMLAGQPGFESKLRRDQQLREDVLQIRQPLSVGRPELEQSGVAGIIERAVAPTGRYDNVNDFAKDLRKIYSSPPPERRKIPRRLWIVMSIAAVALLIAGIIAALTLLQVISG
jgi:serine/threonine protein kinase